jgi:uncharacterized protein (DUF697 family)
MSENLNESKIQQALGYAYEKACAGFTGVDSALELVESYKKEYPDDSLKQVDAIIRWQVTKSAASGFLAGLGGLVTLPVAIPANILSVLYIQIRMILAIAIIGGYDPKDDKVKALVYACLAGSKIKDILKDAGIDALEKIAIKLIEKHLTEGAVVRINRAVGYRLLAKFGAKGVVNASKLVPIIGGLIGGSMDAIWTKGIGQAAKKCFIEEKDYSGIALG